MKAFVRFDGHEFVELLPDDFTRDEYETLLQEFQVPTGHHLHSRISIVFS